VIHCVAVCCSVLQCVTLCCSTLQRFTLCVAVRCSALQRVAVRCSALQYVAVCCSVLQCVAVCSSVLQCMTYDSRYPLTLSTENATHRSRNPPKRQTHIQTHTLNSHSTPYFAVQPQIQQTIQKHICNAGRTKSSLETSGCRTRPLKPAGVEPIH